MIDTEFLFRDLDGHLALWCGADAVGGDLAAMAERAVAAKMPVMSVVPDAVDTVWPWLEKTNVDISARFYLDNFSDAYDAVSDLAARINRAFRRGAGGVQIFVRARDMDALARAIRPVRDDLFFNKELAVGTDIGEIDACEWGGVFDALGRMNASRFVLAHAVDAGAKSDFVGRVYGMLDTRWAWRGGIDFVLGDNAPRIDQAWRLVHDMRPDLAENVRFFIS